MQIGRERTLSLAKHMLARNVTVITSRRPMQLTSRTLPAGLWIKAKQKYGHIIQAKKVSGTCQ